MVEKLLAEGADVNTAATNVRGRTALQAAAEGGYLANPVSRIYPRRIIS